MADEYHAYEYDTECSIENRACLFYSVVSVTYMSLAYVQYVQCIGASDPFDTVHCTKNKKFIR